jgi:hypothetical protein
MLASPAEVPLDGRSVVDADELFRLRRDLSMLADVL